MLGVGEVSSEMRRDGPWSVVVRWWLVKPMDTAGIPRFSEDGLTVLDRQAYNPEARSGYDMLSGGLMWPDEFPRFGSPEWEAIAPNYPYRYLIAYRAAITLGEERAEFRPVWEQVARHAPNWPGLHPERRGSRAKRRLLAAKRRQAHCFAEIEAKMDEARAAAGTAEAPIPSPARPHPMRSRRLRLRTLLIAVAVVGVALGGWQMWRRRVDFLRRAEAYGLLERWTRELEKEFLHGKIETEFPSALDAEMLEAKGSPEKSKQYVDGLHEAENWLATMSRKYERAGRSPWLPVEPDPPPPPSARRVYPVELPSKRWW